MEDEKFIIELTSREIRVLARCIYTYKYLYFSRTDRKIDNKETGLIDSKLIDILVKISKKTSPFYSYKISYFLDEKIGNEYKYEKEIETLKKTIEYEDEWVNFTEEEKKELITDYFQPLQYRMETVEYFVRYGDEYHLKNN